MVDDVQTNTAALFVYIWVVDFIGEANGRRLKRVLFGEQNNYFPHSTLVHGVFGPFEIHEKLVLSFLGLNHVVIRHQQLGYVLLLSFLGNG